MYTVYNLAWVYLLTIIGILWIITPYIMYKISLITVDSEKIENLNKGDRKYLIDVAQRTWQFFRDYLTTENNYLIPDNYQEDRKETIVPRTS